LGCLNRLLHERTAEALALVFEGDIDLGDIKSVLELSRCQESYRSATSVIRDPQQARVEAGPPRERRRRVHLLTKTMFDKELPCRQFDEGQCREVSSRAGRIDCAVGRLIVNHIQCRPA